MPKMGYKVESCFSVRLPIYHKKYVVEQCKEMNISISEFIRFLILNDYRKYNKVEV